MINEITLYEFNCLTKREKTEVLCEYGEYLMERPDPVYRIASYHLYNFYVEIKYDVARNDIAEFQIFTNIKLLEPYLPHIDISSLIS